MDDKNKLISRQLSFRSTNIFGLLLATLLFLTNCNSADKETHKSDGAGITDTVDVFGRYKNLHLTGDPINGQKLYKENSCAACHSLSDRKITASGLARVLDRVPKPTEEWLTRFIINCDKVRLSGDQYANDVFLKSGNGMPIYSRMTVKEAKDIIAYIARETK